MRLSGGGIVIDVLDVVEVAVDVVDVAIVVVVVDRVDTDGSSILEDAYTFLRVWCSIVAEACSAAVCVLKSLLLPYLLS